MGAALPARPTGRLFAAGECFAVRNSGATAVAGGSGHHACEDMAGGLVVILGETGGNFGAGMTDGIAFVFDPAGRFEQRYDPELVKVERATEPADSYMFRQLVPEDAEKTGNGTAWDVLETGP